MARHAAAMRHETDIKMYRNFRNIAMTAILASMTMNAAEPNLPKVEILGQEYYCYEIKKGDSMYGIAKQFGWDVDELARLNPNTLGDMKKGAKLYYPTGRVTAPAEAAQSEPTAAEQPAADDSSEEPEVVEDLSEEEYEPITHVVKKGETVYSISKMYNLPLEAIYESHPSARKGIKAGEVIEIRQSAETVAAKGRFMYYNIKPGDTLYSLAKRYNVGVADILKANPGVSETNFKAGETIRIGLADATRNVRTELVDESRLQKIDNYKVKKGETWRDISKKTGVPVEQLKEANENVAELKKNELIGVPKTEVVQVEKEYVETDPRDETPEGRVELYDSINKTDSEVAQLREVRVAMLMDEPSSKKDQEFSRGFLVALDRLKHEPYKINFKVIDGRSSTSDIESSLDDFEPELVISTADKSFPAFLADYGNTNKVEIINVFDVKSDLYTENASMVHFLTPSDYFNDQIADYIFKNFGDRKILLIGDEDANDGISESLLPKLDDANVRRMSARELADFGFDALENYLVYAYPTKKEEAVAIIDAVASGMEKSPASSITLVGRPSWITFADAVSDRLERTGTLIPSRFYYDTQSADVKSFTEDFQKMFGHQPLKSYPTFAAVGFDVAEYFIPTIVANGGDFNRDTRISFTPLQSDIDLERVSNWGGWFNPACYMLLYQPGKGVERITVK